MVTHNFSIFKNIPLGAEFDRDAFIATLEKQHEKKENYRNPSPPETPFFYLCPISPSLLLGKARDQHCLQALGVLQVPLPRLFRVLRSRQRQVLLAGDPTSSQPLLLTNTLGQNEVLLQQKPVQEHVPVGQEPRQIVPQVSKAFLQFL